MSKLLSEISNSNSSQSQSSDQIVLYTQKSKEKICQTQKIQIQNETPLSTKGNVKSYCRFRPNYTVFNCINRFTIENNNKTLSVDFTPDSERNNPSKQNRVIYNFTEIFGPGTKNEVIFDKICKENIQQIFSKQKNALIFVYGITNSGKTYTVTGDSEKSGILQLSLIMLFNEFDKLRKNNSLWQLTCTYIEIYNEEVFDLLSKDRKKLKIGGSSKFFPQGAIVKNIEEKKDFEPILEFGHQNRSKGETNANPFSSRSHSIFRVELSYKGNKFQNKHIEPTSLCIVDLAGAERVSKSGVSGNGIKEAGNINTSLLCLKKCFDAMEANSKINCPEKKVIVPVRESKLTQLFKEYFAAHQNISIICTINPDKNEMNDIRSVLNFGSHAMKVKTVKSWIKINKNISPSKPGSRDNSPLPKDLKRYRMYTNKKYLIRNYINSNEKDSKVKEDSYSNNSSFNSEKGDIFHSSKKMSNIKLISGKKNEHHYSPFIINKHIHINDENSNNNTKINEERKKCTTNPFQLLSTNKFFVKFSASKERQNLEKQFKEKQIEMKEKISKRGDELKQAFYNYIKKMYYHNLNQNIEIYENQCKNIDFYEIESILSKKNNNVCNLSNPFIKNFEEDKKILNKNLKICVDNNIMFPPQLDNTRTTNQIMEDLLDIKLDNENEHDHTKIQEYLDRSYEQYQTTKFKAYFGIGESLVKKAEDKINSKAKEIIMNKFNSLNNDIEMVDKPDKKEIEKKDESKDELLEKEYNFKRKNKKIQEKNENNENLKIQNKDNKDNKDNKENIDDNIINEKEEENKKKYIKNDYSNPDEQSLSDDKSEDEKGKINKKKRKKSKKRNKSKKQKTQEEDDESKDNNQEKKNKTNKNKKQKEQEEEDESKNEEIKDNKEEVIENNDEEEEISSKNTNQVYPKKKRNKKKESKNSSISSDDNSDNEKSILVEKNRRKKKNKKKKIESDNENEDDSLSDDNANIKPPKTRKGKSKKRRH